MQAPTGVDMVEIARIFDEEVRPRQLYLSTLLRVGACMR